MLGKYYAEQDGIFPEKPPDTHTCTCTHVYVFRQGIRYHTSWTKKIFIFTNILVSFVSGHSSQNVALILQGTTGLHWWSCAVEIPRRHYVIDTLFRVSLRPVNLQARVVLCALIKWKKMEHLGYSHLWSHCCCWRNAQYKCMRKAEKAWTTVPCQSM